MGISYSSLPTATTNSVFLTISLNYIGQLYPMMKHFNPDNLERGVSDSLKKLENDVSHIKWPLKQRDL